jgi:1-aminocyclopropane-1-carboxylate deaminase
MNIPSPLTEIHDSLFKKAEITVYIKRDDLIHPYISGNKWRKLKYNIQEAIQQKKDTVLTFGGAYSNHIQATAFSAKYFGINSIGIIRGEYTEPLNPTLQTAMDNGMKIFYLNRLAYRQKEKKLEEILQKLEINNESFYIIPEGGYNKKGARGCAEIISEIEIDFDYFITACGTGTTLAGISSNLKSHQKAIGIPVLKGGEFIHNNLSQLTENKSHSVELFCDYHFGGYAKYTDELMTFIQDFYHKHTITLDPIYTGKMIYAFYDKVKQGYFPKNSVIILLHTGGLQGIDGFNKRFNKTLPQL